MTASPSSLADEEKLKAVVHFYAKHFLLSDSLHQNYPDKVRIAIMIKLRPKMPV
jgi:hypothetical protein